jgi:hypothetical protein
MLATITPWPGRESVSSIRRMPAGG